MEVIEPTARQLAKGAIVKLLQQLADSGAELSQGEVLTVSQGRQDPALDDQHTAFHLSLIAGLANPCGDNGYTIMTGHILISRVQVWLVTVGLADTGAEVARNHQLRHPVQKREGSDMGANPTWPRLSPGE